MFQQSFEDIVGLEAFGLGVEVGDDAVAEDGEGDGADVVGGDVVAAVEDGAGLGGEDEVLAGAWAGAPGDVVADELGDVGLAAAGGAGEADGVVDHVRGDGNVADDLLERRGCPRRRGLRETVGFWPEVVRRTISISSSSSG